MYMDRPKWCPGPPGRKSVIHLVYPSLQAHSQHEYVILCHIPARAHTISRARLCHSTILSALGPGHALTVLFLGTHASRTFQWVTHPGNALAPYLLNFGVPMEPEANELPKGLVLGRNENIHVRLTRSTPLGDVGSYNPRPLGARRPRRHTSGQGLALIPNCHIQARAPTTSRARLRRSTILSALGPGHALTVLFLGTHASRTFQWVTHPGNALAPYSLNFGVLMEPEANELPKGLMLGRDGNIHVRLT